MSEQDRKELERLQEIAAVAVSNLWVELRRHKGTMWVDLTLPDVKRADSLIDFEIGD